MNNTTEAGKSTANNRQIGGDHYKTGGIEIWDIIAQGNIDYLTGNAVKYIVRCYKKAGLQDLEKAIHYIDKRAEVLKAGVTKDLGYYVQYEKLLDVSEAWDLVSWQDTALHYLLTKYKDLDQARAAVQRGMVKIVQAQKPKWVAPELLPTDFDNKRGEISTPGSPDDGGHHDAHAAAMGLETPEHHLKIPMELNLFEWKSRPVEERLLYEFFFTDEKYRLKPEEQWRSE